MYLFQIFFVGMKIDYFSAIIVPRFSLLKVNISVTMMTNNQKTVLMIMKIKINPTNVTKKWLELSRESPFLSPKEKAVKIGENLSLRPSTIAVLGNISQNITVKREANIALYILMEEEALNKYNLIYA